MKLLNKTIKLIQHKFSHRITGLFLLSALIPLITTAYLSKNYISKILIEQGYTQLQRESKYYGTALYDRLLLIETRLKHIAASFNYETDITKPNKSYLGSTFSSLNIKKIFPQKPTVNLNNIKSNIIYQQTADGVEVFISILSRLKNSQIIKLTAKISKNYLWDNEKSSSVNISNCIIDHAGITLYCSDPAFNSVNKSHTIEKFNNGRKIHHWSLNGIEYISTNRVFFLKSRFNAENWKLNTIKAKSDIFSPVANFNKLFTLVTILTLLVVALLSIIQVRRSLIPLEKLIRATENLANSNFSQNIEIKSNNEFFTLAQSFNSMSERLQKHISALTALSNIDQIILASPESEKIYLTIFEYIQNISPCSVISITLLEHDTPNVGNSFIYNEGKSFHERVKINEGDLLSLKNTIGKNLLVYAEKQSFLTPVKRFTAQYAYIFPIAVDDSLCAFITLGYKHPPLLSNEDIQQIDNISDRLAVAITAAARDKKLYQQSYYDGLTGLPNRQLLITRLEKEISVCVRNECNLAVLFLDLDRFKIINDTLGHAVGDELLVELSKRLLKCIRKIDTVARLGGDEFTIILSNSIKIKDISIVADKIIEKISKPYYIKKNELFISASIGISVFPNDGTTSIELLKNADTAMYRAKETGRGKHLFFEEQMNIEEMERASLENDLRNALERNEFTLHYQPLIDLRTDNIIGAEALIRWQHFRRGSVPVEKFISIAEETGLIEKIGEWVLHTACSQFSDWTEAGCNLERIAVNVSSRQFLQKDFINKIDSILNKTKIPANKLELEITESLLMNEQIDTDEILLKISNKEIKLSIDDFGTGFSSLSYLKRFPLNTLKIDRSFMQDVPYHEDACSIVKSIITLGHTLKLKVVAEGITSLSQLKFIKENACDYAQGHYFSTAIPADEFFKLLLKQNSDTKNNSKK